jgi:tetratricopeptide (TPR) repeat protein
VRLEQPLKPIRLIPPQKDDPPQKDVRFCAVSPDGSWVATGSHWIWVLPAVKVWDARTGKHKKDLPVEGSSHVGFSPDGRWLVTTGGGCRLWHTDTWEEGPAVGGTLFAFSPDSKLLAVDDGFGMIRLVDPNTGKDYARLEAPDQTRLWPQCFTADGTQLLATGMENQALQIWDLAAIHEQLAQMKTPWDLPLAARRNVNAKPRPMAFKVLLGMLHPALREPAPKEEVLRQAIAEYTEGLRLEPKNAYFYVARAILYRRQLDPEKAAADYQKALQLDGEQVIANNNLAWIYVTGPPQLRAPKKALPLALKAFQLVPTWSHRNTLGVAYYRLGQFDKAVQTLEPNLDDPQNRELAIDLFFLAMSYHQVGDAAKSRTCYERALQQMDAAQPQLAPVQVRELRAFRAEADALLAKAGKGGVGHE